MEQAKSASQRRQVTVMFADMADYTPAAAALGEEAAFDLMRQLLGRMRDVVAAHGGTVQSLTGDGMIALFGAPSAIADAPLAACRAAIAIQASMREYEDVCAARYGLRPRFRIGLHSGRVVLGSMQAGESAEIVAVGDTVNMAARLQLEAAAGEVVMSDATQAFVAGFVASAFLGRRRLKGRSSPLGVHRLDAVMPRISRFDLAVERGLTELIGRATELERLRRAWVEARGRSLRIVNVTGEAGIGKTRLVHEFQRDAHLGAASFPQARCAAQGQATPFLPFIDIVRASLNIGPGAARTEVEGLLRRGLALLGVDEAALPYLLNLLGHASDKVAREDPEVVGARTRDALHGLLRERYRIAPSILFIDDAHWIDRASEELIGRICRDDADLPLLIVCAFRSGHGPPWTRFAGCSELRLGQLSPEGTADLVRRRLGTDRAPDGLVRLISANSEGNPLFAEEILNYLLDKGRVETNGREIVFHGAEPGDLPALLENLLMERVDQLASGPRATLETAAAIGAGFPEWLLRAATGTTRRALAVHLDDMQHRDLVVAEPGRKGFRFKHALIREAVYNSILKDRREGLHEEIAERIAASRDAADFTDQLAWHFSRSGNAERAVHYLGAAGRRSLTVFSLPEAESYFRRAIEVAERQPASVEDTALVDILLGLFRVLQLEMRNHEIIRLAERYRQVAERAGDARRNAMFLFWLGIACVNAGEPERSRLALERALAIGDELDDDAVTGYATAGLMWLDVMWGDFTVESRVRTLQHTAAVHRLGLLLRNDFLVFTSLLAGAIYLTLGGRPADGRRRALRLIEHGRTTHDPRPRVWGLLSLALTNAVYFEHAEAIANVDEALAVGPCPVDRVTALGYRGMAQAALGRWSEALPALRDVHARCMEGGMMSTLVGPEFALAEAMIATGDGRAGMRAMEAWRARLKSMNCAWGEGYFHLRAGEVHMRMARGVWTSGLAALRRGDVWGTLAAPFAARRALAHLRAASEYYRDRDMPALLAWSLMDLGDLHLAGRDVDGARACLDEAATVAAASGEQSLQSRIALIAARLPKTG